MEWLILYIFFIIIDNLAIISNSKHLKIKCQNQK